MVAIDEPVGFAWLGKIARVEFSDSRVQFGVLL